MNRLPLSLTRACAIFCFMLCCAVIAGAQEPKRGFHPGGSYAISDIETISTSGGNLSLSVPLGGLPAGRGGLKASVNLVYNSKLWDTYQETTYGSSGQVYDQTWMQLSTDGGWRFAFKYELDIDFKYLNGGLDLCDPNLEDAGRQVVKLMITLPDGSRHALRLDGRSADGDYADVRPDGIHHCQNTPVEFGTLTYFSHDGSFLRLDVEHDSGNDWTNNPWTLYLPDGGRVTGGDPVNTPQRIYDRNNNYIEVIKTFSDPSYGGHDTDRITDQLGRSIVVEYSSAPNQDTIHARGAYNELLTWNVLYTTINVNKTYLTVGSPNNRQLAQAIKVVSQITLPSQAGSLSYNFGYNANTASPSYGWGELSSITLPSGAKASYIYRLDGINSVYSKNAVANNPTSKSLVYRPEYDLASNALPSNTACNTQTESCITEVSTYAFAFNTNWELLDTTITAPDGGVSRDYFNQDALDGRNYKTERPDGTVIERRWQNNTPRTTGPIYLNPTLAGTKINPYVKSEYTSIRDAAGNLTKTAIKEYSQDKNGNVTEVKEYDWVSYTSVQRDTSGRPYGVGGATPKRVTTTAYYNPTPDASDSTTADTDTYHLANTSRLHGLAQATEVKDASSVTRSRTEFYYDNTSAVGYVATTIGNLTSQKMWDSVKGAYSNPLTSTNSVSTSTQYNSYGSPTLSTDARGTQTQLTYGAVNGYSGLYPTTTKVAYGTTAEQVITREYDFYTGAVTRETDPNGVATATTYDAFGRPTLVKAAEGITAKETRTATAYSDVYRRVIVRSDLSSIGDAKLVSIQHHDQLGRVRLSRQLENAATQSETDETTGIKVQTRYLYSGQNSYTVVSNPYRASSSSAASTESSMGWARSKSDNGGRTLETQTFSGATLPAPWGGNTGSTGTVTTAYDGEFTTVTDQSTRARRSMTNGMGQLARVDEPHSTTGSLGPITSPVQPTSYTYDALGNLTGVAQDTQTRTFNYSSLSRLTSATNPESGTVSYTYDDGGNLLTKTDARPITITYTYDALSRNSTVDYSNTTVNPDIERYYDNPTTGMYGRGRYWYDYKGGNYSAGSEVEHRAVDAYDALGRPLTQRQHFKTGGVWSGAYTTSRTYTRSGSLQTQTLPSGHTVSYAYDTVGRLQNFTGNLGDGATRTYATGIGYDPSGRLQQEQFGTQTALHHKLHYNVRGQLNDIRLSTVAWATDQWNWNRGAIINYYAQNDLSATTNEARALSGPDNNGNVILQQHWIPNDDQISGYQWMSQYYTYDALNRITSVTEQANGATNTGAQAYDYDRWGNRTIKASGTWGTGINNKQFTVNAATNQLGVPSTQTGTMTYDAAGNLTDDTYTGAGTRTFDAENRMTAAVIGINSSAAYNYDADGRRVRRSTPNGTVWQIYGFDGELLAEYAASGAASAPQKEYGYRGGELLVTAEGGGTSTYLSDLNWTYAATSYYQTTKDLTVGGTPLTLNGATYAKGLGVHANAEVRYNLGGNYETFAADIGIDDYVGSQGSVTFEVWADGTKLYDSGVMTGGTARKNVAVGVVGKQELKLIVTQAGDGPSHDHADWAGARLIEAPPAVNVAAASQGATASASSVYPYGTYTAAATINGDRKGENWGAGGGWNDGTANSYPDWVEVQFAGVKTIDEVDVFTCQDNYASPSVPTETMIFSLYGLTAFEVQYWTGSAWATVQNGSVNGNDKVWRKFTFPAVTTSKIRVYTSAGLASYSRLTEIEAYESKQAAADVRVQWLVADHLGTPRMIANLSGSLAGIKRHDYLPFGEEVGTGVGGRTVNQGYSGMDNVRQKFTSYERDKETGLDYAQARYYASEQGRFIIPDDFLNDSHASDPASWNLYAYVRNNPLSLIDPSGQTIENTNDKKRRLSNEQLNAIEKDLQKKTGLSSIKFVNGKLTYDKTEVAKGGSAALRQSILGAVNDPKNVFKLSDHSGTENLQFAKIDAGTVDVTTGISTYDVQIDFADFHAARGLSDTDALNAFTLGTELRHEIDHKVSYDPSNPILGATRPDVSPRPGYPGVIDNDNVVRSQLGLISRASGAHEGQPYRGADSRYKGTYQIQFNDSSGKTKFLRWKLEGSR
ncbi:MAG TPA: NPCBM/NEW2 domain-containing protein [Pyrinomonadaceae bacterium]|jgi:RHS repeat-associated protein